MKCLKLTLYENLNTPTFARDKVMFSIKKI